MGVGFTTFTGETGAGKSILLGAIGLCLGKRADSHILHDKTKKCIVELTVNLKSLNLESYFNEKDVDFFSETIIRREISAQGRSRSFVNDSPVKLDVLQHIGERLVDVHSQHDTLLINSTAYQLSLVDLIAKNQKEKDNYTHAFADYKQTLEGQRNFLKSSEIDIDVDYLTFLAEELANADVKKQEVEELELDIKTFENAEEIQTKLGDIDEKFNREEVGVLSVLAESLQGLNSISGYNSKFSALAERVESCRIELADIVDEIELEAGNVEDNPQKLLEFQERYNVIQHLLQKHRVETIDELLEKLEEINQTLLDFQNRSSEIKNWEEKVAQSNKIASRKADDLTKTRKKVLPKLAKEINAICKTLNFSDPDFRIELIAQSELKANGNDLISFLFSANKGHEPKRLEKAASGGERSRVMLALKSILAKTHGLPTIIFDEIDTGVSGETAIRVASILKEMGSEMQVWAITHLPQIAASGEHHYRVIKQNIDGVTQTFIKELNDEQRIETLAQMLSGAKPTKAAVENARELLMVS